VDAKHTSIVKYVSRKQKWSMERNNQKIINKKRSNMLSSTILDLFDVI
jgi:hypothetical protein